MNWFLLALGSAVLWSVALALEKKVLADKQHSLSVSAVHSALAFLFSLPLLYFADVSSLSLELIALMYVLGAGGALALWLIAKGLKHMEMSTASPLLVTSLLFLPVLAFFFVGERLNAAQVAGILLVIVGVVMLESLVAHGRFFHLQLKEERYVFVMLTAAFIMALTSIGDKIVISQVSPFTYLPIIYFFLSLNSLALVLLLDKSAKSDLQAVFSRDFKLTAASALFSLASSLFFLIAISQAFISLSVAVKRIQSLFSVFLGGKLFHEDKIREKMLACIVMLLGAALLALS